MWVHADRWGDKKAKERVSMGVTCGARVSRKMCDEVAVGKGDTGELCG